jgi:N utilization substance protein A
MPVRTCAGCGRRAPQAELQRFTAPDGTLRPDVGRKAPGRGVYTCRTAACVERARSRGAFVRALRRPVRVPAGLDVLFGER